MYTIYVNIVCDILKYQNYITLKSRISNNTTVDECAKVCYQDGHD